MVDGWMVGAGSIGLDFEEKEWRNRVNRKRGVDGRRTS